MKVLSSLFITALTLGSVQTAAAALPLCASIHKPMASQLMQSIANATLPKLISNLERPEWKEYNEVSELIQALERSSNEKKSSEELNSLQSKFSPQAIQLKKIYQSLESQPATKAAFNRYLDYHFSYFQLLEKANRLAGGEIFAIPDLSKIQSNEQLKVKAQQLVKSLEVAAESSFSETGFRNEEEFTQFMKQHSPKAQRLLEIAQDEAVVAVRRPEGARFWIPLAGFQNQRVTGSSRGIYFEDSNTKKISERDEAEANLAGIAQGPYARLSARFKPNYGTVRPRAEVQDFEPETMSNTYGEDLWVIKKDVIEKRATWYMTDSLGPGLNTPPGATNIRSMFVPWKYRALMAAYALEAYGTFKPARWPKKFKGAMPPTRASYFEVQIFGPLNIDDVQAFHFRQNPPDKAFYDLLVSKKIEVWDERRLPAKRYNGEESN